MPDANDTLYARFVLAGVPGKLSNSEFRHGIVEPSHFDFVPLRWRTKDTHSHPRKHMKLVDGFLIFDGKTRSVTTAYIT